MLDLVKKIYLGTNNQSLRKFYYYSFCTVVRNRTVQKSIDGLVYELDLGERIDVGLYLSRYEKDMVAAIEKYCRPKYNVLDIGANIGAHTLRLAKIVGESGNVYAFEPTDYAYRKLVHNISLNHFKNIIPIHMALSDRNLLRQNIQFISSWPTKGSTKKQKGIVDFIKLDNWCKRENIDQVNLIKLDVDGNEYSVIEGAKSLLTNQHPLILMEVWGPNFADNLKNPFTLLKQLGYRFFHIDSEKEYEGVDSLRAIVSSNGQLLNSSFNMIARC